MQWYVNTYNWVAVTVSDLPSAALLFAKITAIEIPLDFKLLPGSALEKHVKPVLM